MRKHEPTLEVSMTLSELRAVIKSLAIGVDQLAKKIQRFAMDERIDSVHTELTELLSAKHEMETVLALALQGDSA
jgi:uncharacterized coiled-coil DUF342 family protein